MNNFRNKLVKIKVLFFLLKIKIIAINTEFTTSNCDLTNFKTKFYNTNTNQMVIEEYHESWKNLTRLIMRKPFLQKVERLLFILQRLLNIIEGEHTYSDTIINTKDVRQFNTLFTIAFFPKMVCENNVKNKDIIIDTSQEIVNNLIQISNSHKPSIISIVKLGKKIQYYLYLFEIWQDYDKEFMVYTLAKHYLLNEIKMNKPLSNLEDNQKIYYNAFKREQLSIKQDIKYIGSEKWKTKFNSIINNINNYDKVVKSLYWLNVDYDLYKTPPNINTVLKLFMETKRLIKNLVPNRKDIIDELDDILNEQIIKDVLNEKEIDNSFFNRKCEYILEKLQLLQSAVMDKPLEDFKTNFVNKIPNNEYFRDLIPFFFRFVLDSLEKIHEEKEAFIDFIKN